MLTPPAAPTPPPPVYIFTFAGTPEANELVEDGPRGTTPIAAFAGIEVSAIALDSAGTIYAANVTSVREYSPKAHQLLRTISGFHDIVDLKFDARGNLYVVDAGYNGFDEDPPKEFPASLQEFAPGAIKPFRTITTDNPNPGDFISLAIDRSGTLFAGSQSDNVAVIPPGALHSARTLPGTQFAAALAFDTTGNLYVDSLSTSKTATDKFPDIIQVFAPGGSKPLRTISAGVGSADTPRALALSSTNELFVANGFSAGTSFSTTVTEYAAQSTVPVHNFGPFFDANSVAIDVSGNVYVLDGGSYTTVGGLSEFTGNRRFVRRLPLAIGAFALSTQP